MDHHARALAHEALHGLRAEIALVPDAYIRHRLEQVVRSVGLSEPDLAASVLLGCGNSLTPGAPPLEDSTCSTTD